MSQLSRRGALRLFGSLGAAGAAAPLLSACGSSGDDEGDTRSRGTIKIGLLLPQTGVNKATGDDMRQGFELFLNLNGRRLGGYDVQLVEADEGDTAATAKAAIEKLKNDKVLAISGGAGAIAMTEARETVEAAHIPLIGSNASPQQLNTIYMWRTSCIDNEQGDALGPYVASQIGAGTAYMIGADQVGRDAIQGFQQSLFSARGKIEGAAVFVPVGVNTFGQWLNPLKESDTVKAVFASFTGATAEAFVKEFSATFKGTLPLFGPAYLTEGALLKAQGEAAKGVWTASNYSPDLDNAANRTFVAEYQKQFQASPTAYAMSSYDAAAVISKALPLVDGELSGETLNAAIGRVGQISSPRGDWQFNQNRSPQQRWYLRQVRKDGSVLANSVVSELSTLG